jgi:hypothetical protein
MMIVSLYLFLNFLYAFKWLSILFNFIGEC